MNGRMDEWNFSPFYRTSTPIRDTAQKLDLFSWAGAGQGQVGGAWAVAVEVLRAWARNKLMARLMGRGSAAARLRDMGRGSAGENLRGMGSGSAGVRLRGMGRSSLGARLRGMGRGSIGASL